MSTTTTEAPIVKNDKLEVSFGEGKYSSIMKSFFKSLQVILKLDEKQAEKAARALGADLGRLNINIASLTFSKPNKDGETSIREGGTLKHVAFKYSFTLFKLCTVLQEAKVYHVTNYDKITLSTEITEWLNS